MTDRDAAVREAGPTILDAWQVIERNYPEATVARLYAALAPPSVTGDAGLRAALRDIALFADNRQDAWHDHPDDFRKIANAARVALAQPVTPEYGGALANQRFAEPAEGLDVERLAMALEYMSGSAFARHKFYEWAAEIAAEYARLRSETPEAGT